MSALPLRAESLGDFEVTPELDAQFTALALYARSDLAARDALYRALDFKIGRFVRRYRYRANRLVVCELDDIGQEAFLVFCDLLQRWPGRESFLGYFFSRFPWRLARAIDVIERGWAASRLMPLEEIGEPLPLPNPDDPFVLAEIGAGLRPRDRQVLELRIGHGLRLNEIARLLGIHPRTVYRAWDRIEREIRAGWAGSLPLDPTEPPMPPTTSRGRSRVRRTGCRDGTPAISPRS